MYSVGELFQISEVFVSPQGGLVVVGAGLTKPGMISELLQRESLQLGAPQTAGHQAPRVLRDKLRPGELLPEDLLVCEEGDVAHQHVVQQDPQAPHSQTLRTESEQCSEVQCVDITFNILRTFSP